MASPEEVMQDVQRLIALRPTDPMTGALVGSPQSAEYAAYREELLDIVDRYGSVEGFQEEMRDSGVRPEQQLAKAAPVVPDSLAGPPAEVNLARFAQNMMAPGPPPGPPPGAAGAAQKSGPPALMPRRGTGMVL